jgi:Tfp pilus assembly PilM family ATPase
MGLFSHRRVGVDIGASAVRVVEVVGVDSDGFAIIRRVGIHPLPDGAVSDGEVQRPVDVGEAIAAAIREARVPRYGFVVGLSARSVGLGRVTIPDAVGPHERNTFIRNQNKEITPTVKLVDAALSWNTLTSALKGGRIVHHLNVAVASKNSVDKLLTACQYAGVQPMAVDLTGAALVRSVCRVPADDDSVVMIADIGASKTLLATREGQHLRSVRVLRTGSAKITRTLQGLLRVSFEEAERIKRTVEVGPNVDVNLSHSRGPGSEFSSAAGPAYTVVQEVRNIGEQIANAIDNESADGRRPVQGILLVGGGSRQPGFAERVRAQTGIPAEVASQWAELQYSKRTAHYFRLAGDMAEPDPDILTGLTTAVGLALWRKPV